MREQDATHPSVATFTVDGWAEDGREVVHAYTFAREALAHRRDICTTQMCLMNFARDMRYDIIRIIADGADDVIELRDCHDGTYHCDRTDRELRYAHNLFKMWENGVFE